MHIHIMFHSLSLRMYSVAIEKPMMVFYNFIFLYDVSIAIVKLLR